MGCDIHIVLERRQTGMEWVGVWCSDTAPGRRSQYLVSRRDYGLFGHLAGVRSLPDGYFTCRNLPLDVSRLAWLQYMQAPIDHHSASHLSLQEFIVAFDRANPGESSADYRKEHAAYDLFGVDEDWPESCEYRVVFWFDN